MEQSNAIRGVVIESRQQSAVTQILWITAFALLTAVGAQIEVPHYPVPFTLQSFFVLLAGAVLGARNGAASQLLYLAIGIAGLPVFSGWGFGVARFLGPTGGYLLSFPIAAFVVGYLIRQNRRFVWTVLSMMLGLLVVFSLGTLQLKFYFDSDWSTAFANGFLIFSWWDLLKVISAAGIYQQIGRRFSR